MWELERKPTIKKAEHQRIDAFELWCWRRLLTVPWTARRSNQSILVDWTELYSSQWLYQFALRQWYFKRALYCLSAGESGSTMLISPQAVSTSCRIPSSRSRFEMPENQKVSGAALSGMVRNQHVNTQLLPQVGVGSSHTCYTGS